MLDVCGKKFDYTYFIKHKKSDSILTVFRYTVSKIITKNDQVKYTEKFDSPILIDSASFSKLAGYLIVIIFLAKIYWIFILYYTFYVRFLKEII